MKIIVRGAGQSLLIGDDICVTVVSAKLGRIKIGVESRQEIEVIEYEKRGCCEGQP